MANRVAKIKLTKQVEKFHLTLTILIFCLTKQVQFAICKQNNNNVHDYEHQKANALGSLHTYILLDLPFP